MFADLLVSSWKSSPILYMLVFLGLHWRCLLFVLMLLLMCIVTSQIPGRVIKSSSTGQQKTQDSHHHFRWRVRIMYIIDQGRPRSLKTAEMDIYNPCFCDDMYLKWIYKIWGIYQQQRNTGNGEITNYLYSFRSWSIILTAQLILSDWAIYSASDPLWVSCKISNKSNWLVRV